MSQERFIYFMRPVGMLGPIKIGCSHLPQSRLEDLSVWSPFPLEIVAMVPGDFQLENRLHRSFVSVHHHREWFNPSKELLDGIARLIAGEAIDKAFDLSRDDGPIRRWSRPLSEDTKLRQRYSRQIEAAQRRLRKKLGEKGAWVTPRDLQPILSKWRGIYRKPGILPTEAEIARLDEYLADPEVHSILPWWNDLRRVAA